jgi:deoxyadenosine/deoxycytidine kinase
MVAAVTSPRLNRAGGQRAWIVEIVGPAGAGKTTLFQALEKRAPRMRTAFLPPVWQSDYIPFFVKNIIRLLPVLARMLGRGDRLLTRRELAWMAILQGWPEVLEKEALAGDQFILLDQGPVFLMAILTEFGPRSLRNANIQAWWNKITAKWVKTLDLVVWLDAPDAVLIERIRSRPTDHIVKDKPDHEMKAFLAKYRQEYDRLMSTICENNQGVSLLRIDTSRYSTADIVQSLIDYCNPSENGIV